MLDRASSRHHRQRRAIWELFTTGRSKAGVDRSTQPPCEVAIQVGFGESARRNHNPILSLNN